MMIEGHPNLFVPDPKIPWDDPGSDSCVRTTMKSRIVCFCTSKFACSLKAPVRTDYRVLSTVLEFIF